MTPAPALDLATTAHKSTGPTTQAGKDRSRLNALRHGLAGKTVVMPWEDRAAYETHRAAYFEALAPVGEMETQLVQGIADDEWRLSRARAVDSNMFALGQFDYPATTGDEQMDSALNTARAFRDHSKSFVNLSLYEQRIQRSLEKNFAQLRALQADRQARMAKQDNRSGLIPTKIEEHPQISGQREFVCSSPAPEPAQPGPNYHEAPQLNKDFLRRAA